MARCGNCQSIARGPNMSPRTCLSCGHPLVFNAKQVGFSDLRLMKAMEKLSAAGHLAYTEGQLFHQITGRRQVKPGFFGRFSSKPKPPNYWAPELDRAEFGRQLSQWRQLGGAIKGTLLDTPAVQTEHNRVGQTQLPAEFTPHSFDRVLIVDNASTAVMLIANRFHIDHRCAILSEDGYPEAFRDQLVALLRANPNLLVVTVHGVNGQSTGMARRIRTQWFPDQAMRVVDVGLTPSQAIKGRLWTYRLDRRTEPDQAVLADPALSSLSEAERQFLAWGLHVPLDSLSPTALVQMVTKAFTGMSRFDETQLADDGRERDRLDYSNFDDGFGIIYLGTELDDTENSLLSDFFGGDDFDGSDFDGDG